MWENISQDITLCVSLRNFVAKKDYEQPVIIKGILKKGEYFDPVSLMIAANKISQPEGVIYSAVVMGTSCL